MESFTFLSIFIEKSFSKIVLYKTFNIELND